MNERAERAIANTLAVFRSGGTNVLEKFGHHQFIAGKRFITLLAVTLDSGHCPIWEAAAIHHDGVAPDRQPAVLAYLLKMLDGCGQSGEFLHRNNMPEETALYIPDGYTEVRLRHAAGLAVCRRMTPEELEQVYHQAPMLRSFLIPAKPPGFTIPATS